MGQKKKPNKMYSLRRKRAKKNVMLKLKPVLKDMINLKKAWS